jgi:hypothetical protein
VRQVGHLQELYRDAAQSTEHEIVRNILHQVTLFTTCRHYIWIMSVLRVR